MIEFDLNKIKLENNLYFTGIQLPYFFENNMVRPCFDGFNAKKFEKYFSSISTPNDLIENLKIIIYELTNPNNPKCSNNIPEIIAIKDKETNSLAALTILHNMNANILSIELIFVLEKYRRKGLATLLMETSIKFAKSYEYTTLRLETLKSNQYLVNFYEKFGFVEGGAVPLLPYELDCNENFVEYILKIK